MKMAIHWLGLAAVVTVSPALLRAAVDYIIHPLATMCKSALGDGSSIQQLCI